MELTTQLKENAAATAFGKQAASFDDIYARDPMVLYKRKRVRDHVLRHLLPGSSVLELNAGTGEDAIFFAEQGHQIHATDVAPAMLEKLTAKTVSKKMESLISVELCSFDSLQQLGNRGPFDLVFSNFAGLNCTPQLNAVLASIDPLLKPGGLVTLVLLPPFCLWETILLFRGKFRTVFRRLSGKKGAKAHIEGEYFRCWYYSPKYVIKNLRGFDLVSLEGLCTLVPPSYLQGFDKKHPRLYTWLQKMEENLAGKWPWRSIGDYYIITLQKKIIIK